jgi:hypothetical protein
VFRSGLRSCEDAARSLGLFDDRYFEKAHQELETGHATRGALTVAHLIAAGEIAKIAQTS